MNLSNPIEIKKINLENITGFSCNEFISKAIETKEKVCYNGWRFWLLGETDDWDVFFGHVWAFAPDGSRYIIIDTYTVI